MAQPLHNYLLMHRKRTGLSQGELAVLLGCQEGKKVSRYEHRERQPNLETLLAYEAVTGVPARELYAGVYQKVEQDIKRRAKKLERRLASDDPDPLTERKLTTLRAITGIAAEPNDNNHTKNTTCAAGHRN